MAKLSTARQFFDEMIAGGATAIESLVTDQQHETEWLDFKRGDAHPDDLKCAWSEAVCGFANNQGGVFIVGIDARRDKVTGIDAACAVVPVEKLIATRSRMVDLLRSNVEPPVPGVEVEAIERTNGNGFIVCYVPESANKPHRAEQSAGKPYMIRIADSFQNPSPSLLRSLFFPRSSPKLEVRMIPAWEPAGINQFPKLSSIKIEFSIDVQNIGLTSAKDVYIVIRPSCTVRPQDARISVLGAIHHQQGAFGFECAKPVHPTCNIRMGALWFNMGVCRQDISYVPSGSGVEFEIDIYAGDMPSDKVKIEFSIDDIEYQRPKTGYLRSHSHVL